MKKLALVLVLFSLTGSFYAQCSMRQLSLQDRATASDLIVEGKVISQESYWNDAHNMIYTSNIVEVYKVFKGNLSQETIEILTKGGTVGLDRITAEPSLNFDLGDLGVITCESVKSFVIPASRRSSMPVYEAYSSAQGFIKYDLNFFIAADPFTKYTDVENEIYKVVLAPGMKTWKTIKEFDFIGLANSQKINSNNQVQSISISSFSPTTVTAGTGTTLTINGSGFGSTQGTGTVGFKNADDGGSTYINPLTTQYLSWSDTQIIVEVPSNAGTGTIQVTQGTTQTSSSSVTVSYAHLNVNYDPGSGTTAYQTDHVNDDGAGGYTWQMNTAFDASTSAKAAFMRAFDNWRCNTGINWTIGSTTSVDAAVSDGTNVITFDDNDPLSAGVLGVCYSYWSGCSSGGNIVWYVKELDIIFDEGSNITPLTWQYGPSTPSSSQYDFESVTVHELGHGHQLGHVINSGAIMHYSLSNGAYNRTPGTNDLNGANFVQAKSIVANSCGPGAMTNYTCATAPVADFSGSPTSICAGSSVTFTDASSNTPTSWSWTFTGGSPSTSTSQNPSVSYSTAGTYAVSLTATNSAGSDTKTVSAYITVNSVPSTSVSSQTNVLCNGGSTGSASISVSSGTPSYSYSWSPSGGSAATASSLAAGTYTCTVTDANGCTKTQTVTITQPTAISTSISSSTNVSCNGGSDGSATVSVSGGTTPYAYSWTSGSTSATASSLAAGTYTCTVTDAGGCVKTQTVTITEPTVLSVSTSVVNSSCSGSDGSITLSVSGGTPGYTYSWSTGATTQNVSGLSAGVYTVTITDTNGCQISKTSTVTTSNPPTITASSADASLCSGGSTTLTAGGGATYSWMPGSLSGSSVNVSPTTTTTYTVTGTDNSGCSNTATVTVAVSSSITVTATADNTSICGSGSTTLHASGADTYNWMPGSSTSADYTVSPTSTTTYTLSGTSSQGCTGQTTITITVGTCGTASLTPASCGITLTSLSQTLYYTAVSGATNYQIEVSDATQPYSYVFTKGNNATAFTFSNCFPGVQYGRTYNVRVQAYVNGSWEGYGSTCTVTTPSSVPTTQLSSGSCDITLTSLSQTLYYDAVSGASNYQIEVTDATQPYSYVFTKGNNATAFIFSNCFPGVQYGRTYSVRVQAYVGGVWGSYGSTCTITTPSDISTTQLSASSCDITLTSMSQILRYDAVSGASNYHVEVTDPTQPYSYVFTKNNNATAFLMSTCFPGIQYGRTYSVRVEAYVGGVWGGYGTVCTVTTPASAFEVSGETASSERIMTGLEEEQSSYLKVYPNPNEGAFTISLDKQSQVVIYNALGEIVLDKLMGSGENQLDLHNIPAGVYYVKASGNNTPIKFIKQ